LETLQWMQGCRSKRLQTKAPNRKSMVVGAIDITYLNVQEPCTGGFAFMNKESVASTSSVATFSRNSNSNLPQILFLSSEGKQ